METKYDWSRIPKELKWVSTDWEGWKLYHTSKPFENENIKAFDSCRSDSLGYSQCYEESEFKGDWQDSLGERPK